MRRAAVRSLMRDRQTDRQRQRFSCGMVIKSVRWKRKLKLLDSFSQNSDFQASSCSGVVSLRRDGLNAWMRKGVTNSVEQNFVISLRREIHIEWQSKTQLYLCNIQGVGVCTNVSANYIFRPLPVRPFSGWT